MLADAGLLNVDGVPAGGNVHEHFDGNGSIPFDLSSINFRRRIRRLYRVIVHGYVRFVRRGPGSVRCSVEFVDRWQTELVAAAGPRQPHAHMARSEWPALVIASLRSQ